MHMTRNPHVTHCSSGQPHSSSQTASWSVQTYLYGSQMLCSIMHCQWRRKPPKHPFPWDFVTLPEEDRATANMHKNLVKVASVVPEICWWTDRRTNRHTQTCSSQYFAIMNLKTGDYHRRCGRNAGLKYTVLRVKHTACKTLQCCRCWVRLLVLLELWDEYLPAVGCWRRRGVQLQLGTTAYRPQRRNQLHCRELWPSGESITLPVSDVMRIHPVQKATSFVVFDNVWVLWRRGVVVTALVVSTKLLYVEPG